MFCNIPDSIRHFTEGMSFFNHDVAYVVIMALFSLSNGYLSCICMMYVLITCFTNPEFLFVQCFFERKNCDFDKIIVVLAFYNLLAFKPEGLEF